MPKFGGGGVEVGHLDHRLQTPPEYFIYSAIIEARFYNHASYVIYSPPPAGPSWGVFNFGFLQHFEVKSKKWKRGYKPTKEAFINQVILFNRRLIRQKQIVDLSQAYHHKLHFLYKASFYLYLFLYKSLTPHNTH